MDEIVPDHMMIWARVWVQVRLAVIEAFGEYFENSPQLVDGSSSAVLFNQSETIFINAGNRLGQKGIELYLDVVVNDVTVMVEVVEFSINRRFHPDPDFLDFALPLIERIAKRVEEDS
jgi:hypothetical protein